MSEDSADWARIAMLPTLTIDGSDLDRLELAVGIRGVALRIRPGARVETLDPSTDSGEVVLVDRQATPLALLHLSGPTDAAAPVALRPRADGHSAEWDPAVRRSPAAVRRRIGELDRPRVIGIAFDRLPTRADADALRALLGSDDTVLIVAALVGMSAVPQPRELRHDSHESGANTRRSPLRVGAAALTRAVTNFAVSLDPQRTVVVSLPWSRHPAPGKLEFTVESAVGSDPDTIVEQLLTACGSTETVQQAATGDVEDALADANKRWRDDVERLLPRASALELGRRERRTAEGLPGAVVLFTGLSGSGKSTLAAAAAALLSERGDRATVLDGDDLRRHLSSELGFDRESRSTNVRRIGWVASLIASHGGVALAAPIAPFAADRAEVRRVAETAGAFLLVYVSTPLQECARRDRKGLYARAFAGELAEFTGVSSPYETPDDADVVVDTSAEPIEESLERILSALESRRASNQTPVRASRRGARRTPGQSSQAG